MKAILLRQPGGPSALEYVEVPTPRPGDGRGAGRRRHDRRLHAGGAGAPRHLCLDAALAGDPRHRDERHDRRSRPRRRPTAQIGETVFVSARDLPVRAGCYAEYIAVPAERRTHCRRCCDLEAAACLSNYQVAYHVLHSAARGVAAKTVLVHTAAGGVGSAAVQLALIAGMRVIGVAGSEAKTPSDAGDLARTTRSTTAARTSSRECARRPAGRGVDLILDPIGGKGFGRNFAMLAPLGLVVSYGRLDGPPDGDSSTAMRENHAVSPAVRFFTIHSFDDRPDIRAAATATLIDHLAAGRIAPLIHDRLPLAEAGRAQAHARSGRGHRQGCC